MNEEEAAALRAENRGLKDEVERMRDQLRALQHPEPPPAARTQELPGRPASGPPRVTESGPAAIVVRRHRLDLCVRQGTRACG